MSKVYGEARFSRESFPKELQPLDDWPGADESAFSEKQQKTYAARCEAIDLFVNHPELSLRQICEKTNVSSSTLYEIIERCCKKHPDGRIYGFRGAMPYVRTAVYTRFKSTDKGVKRGGQSGAFSALLERYPRLEVFLQGVIKSIGKKGAAFEDKKFNLRRIHKNFLDHCREAGITATEYPFNQQMLGIRSMAEYIRKHINTSIARAAKAAGANHIKGQFPEDAAATAPPALRAFDVVEFDGHKIDLRLTVKVKDPYGYETLIEISRIWILAIISVATRVVLGYSLALGTEYNKDDIAEALQNALTPRKPRKYRMPNLSVREGGGFPSEKFEEAQYACWDWFKFDGARSHIAGDTLERLTKIAGCWTDNGPIKEPNDRPIIERFFALLASGFAHRFPGTTGSSANSIEKMLNDPGTDLRMLVELDDLEDMVDVLLADYNGEPHSGIGGRTPLEAMQFKLVTQGELVRRIPSRLRRNLCLLKEAKIVTVRGNPATGSSPHINFSNVRYTNSVLANAPGLIGKKLRIYYDVRDICTVKAFFEDGAELGLLTAMSPWNRTPHSLRVRQEIFRLIRLGKLRYREGDDPVECWFKYKREESKKNKKAGNSLAKNKKYAEKLQREKQEGRVPENKEEQKRESSATSAGVEGDSIQPRNKEKETGKPRTMTLKRTITF